MAPDPRALNPAAAGGEGAGSDPTCRRPSLKWSLWLVLVSVDMLGPFSTDSYIPNMPAMVTELHTSDTMAGLTLQLNWLTQGIFNIILGRMADKLGRRPVVIGSFVIYIIGALGCALAPSIGWLLIARVFQGMGQASASITSAIARDAIEDPNERMRMISLLGTVFAFSIIAAPSIGGLIGSILGWRVMFGILTFWGSMNLVLSYCFLPETATPDDEGVPTSNLWRDVCGLFRCRLTRTLIFVFAIKFSGVQCMLSNISLVLEDHYKLGTVQTSLLIGSIPVCIIVGSGVVAICAKNTSPFKLLRNALVGMMVLAVVMFVLAVAGHEHVTWWMIMSTLYCMVLHDAVSTPPLMTLYMQPVKEIAGLASGVQSFTHAMLSTLLSFIATWCTELFGPRGLLCSLGVVLMSAGVVFFCGLGGGLNADELGGNRREVALNSFTVSDDVEKSPQDACGDVAIRASVDEAGAGVKPMLDNLEVVA